ncbi:hypothetical protein FA95DRAFT_90271 [Auriscalpium vulgare]|uniref:Uncharacterized protein n=1 Tax=Auriscalpium vulgare TaxID=40419 RepID=A0ACB8RP70_9AGAM|nr:hypothetical protein FA95DRAFT_90271 [Auriscalpium vulgare]
MNADIMLLANKLVYSDRLKCGTETVARQSLVLPDRSYLQGMHNICCSSDGLCWLEQLMDPHARAVFVDTDRLPALDSRVGDLVQNTLEGALVHQIVETMLRCGVRETQVGVITMYRQQIKLLSQLLLARPDVEILTADRSQGRDKECIVISMVRSNESGHIGDLVRDWRRLNVAFTRARSKLIIVGSRRTLQRTPLLEAFFALMEERKWVLSLPPRAHLLHELPELGTPGKRAREAATIEDGRVKDVDTPRTAKKLRMGEDVALLRTRPILKDMFNDSL